jgi:hypothetical protein
MKHLPFGPEDIVKVHRGMNMVKVSVGEHLSEPSEVYIATIKDEEKLSTNIIFYLIEPKVRTLYGFEGNPYVSSNRINMVNSFFSRLRKNYRRINRSMMPWCR